MALDFPDTPTVGDVFNSGGIAWKWNGTRLGPTPGEVWIGPTVTTPTHDCSTSSSSCAPTALPVRQPLQPGQASPRSVGGRRTLNGVTYSAATKAFTITKAGQYLFTFWILANIASIDPRPNARSYQETSPTMPLPSLALLC